MKKNNLIRFLIFSIFLILSGCSEDLFEEKINQSSIVAKKVSMNDLHFKQNKNLMKSVNLLKIAQTDLTGRYEYNTELDFYIDEQNGVSLVKDSLESYTFPVYKAETDSIVTNIIFNKTITGEYDIVLAEYDILTSELPTLTQTDINQSNVQYTDLTNRMHISFMCIDIQEYQLTFANEGNLNGSYEGIWVTVGSFCSWGGSGVGSGSSGSGSSVSSGTTTGGGGSVGTGSTGGIISTPVSNHGHDSPMLDEFDDTPCFWLKKETSNNQLFKNKFKILNKPTNFELNKETGFGEKMISGVKTFVDLTPIGNTSLKPSVGLLNFTHVHNNHLKMNEDGIYFDAGEKMLSPGDVKVLINVCQPANVNVKNTYAIMASNEGVFALSLLDNVSVSILDSPEWKIFESEYRKDANKICGHNEYTPYQRKFRLQKMILKGLKKLGLDSKIALFEGSVIESPTVYEINWKRKMLDANGSNISEIQC